MGDPLELPVQLKGIFTKLVKAIPKKNATLKRTIQDSLGLLGIVILFRFAIGTLFLTSSARLTQDVEKKIPLS